MNAKVSVIIPTYNYGQFIAAAIESALTQTYQVSEIIVVDDGSMDDTETTVKKFGERVRYIKQQNAGVCAARNRGIENSSGNLIAFLDADDAWMPRKIEKQLAKFAEDEQYGLVHCGMREFDGKTGNTIQQFFDGGEGWVAEDILLWEKPVLIGAGGSIMVRREAIEVVGMFDTRLKNGEDWEFCLRVARKYKVGFVPELLVDYRNHGVNASKNIAEMECSTLMAWNKSFDTDDKNILRLRRQSFGNLHKVLAGSYLQSGQYYGFLRNLLWSLWFRPSLIGYYLPRVLYGKRKNF